MNKIFKTIWAVWALIVFVVTFFIVLIPISLTFILKEPHRGNVVHVLHKGWMVTFLTLVGIRLKIKGKEYFKKGESYVITANHKSFLDVMAIVPIIPGPNKILAKREMVKIPIFGIIYRSGSVLVDRSSAKSRLESVQRMKDVLDRGHHLCLYPEGTRNRTGKPLRDFYDGAFLTAIQTQRPIMPCVLFNTYELFPNKPLFSLMPGVVEAHYLPPIDVSGYTEKDKKQLKELVFQQMWDYIVEHENKAK